jgi:hypothetical protein
MKLLSAGLTFFNVATVAALVTGMVGNGLSKPVAVLAVMIGLVAAFIAYWQTEDDTSRRQPIGPGVSPAETSTLSNRARRRLAKQQAVASTPPNQRYRSIWFWLLASCFAIFAVRSFCWLVYMDNNQYKVQSINNLGDLSLHLTYIRHFASGVPLWPENPIYVFSKLRYPAGVDLFNGVLTCLGIDITRGLVWTGLLACVATCYALYRWAGSFGIAAFLFNGGIASYPFLKTFVFKDYQGVNTIAWKSLPLAMLVTQRGMLYALPAGLLLLYQWRAKFFPAHPETALASEPAPNGEEQQIAAEPATPSRRAPLPFWLELSLYATMPLFHVHTFIALTIVLVILFLFTGVRAGKQLVALVAAALVPASFFVWVISDNFQAGSVMQWKPGWVNQPGSDMAMPFLKFWLFNFGVWVPLVLFFIVITGVGAWKMYKASEFKMPAGLAFLIPGAAFLLLVLLVKMRPWEGGTLRLILVCLLILPLPFLIAITAWKGWKRYQASNSTIPPTLAFLIAAVAIFLLGYLVKMAPWEWDNIKIIIWAYLVILPFLWTDLVSHWPFALRALICIALFGSGFVTFFGGLGRDDQGRVGLDLGDRVEIDAVGVAVKKLPPDARYAGAGTWSHPVLIQGRKMVLGYAGHLWTQGFNYTEAENKLQALLKGAPGWKENARFLRSRYLFWGREEKAKYPASTKPWERESLLVDKGDWGAIYDLESPAARSPTPPQAAKPPLTPGQ